MADSSKLLDALKNYKQTMETHTSRVRDDFGSLYGVWNRLNEVFEGNAASDFKEHWNGTVAQFNEYIEKTNALGRVLDEKINLLEIYDREILGK